jgi:hypothetical protein
MSSGRDEWMSRWTEEDRKRNLESYLGQIPEEFGGPAKGVTGKQYEQLEFDFGGYQDISAVEIDDAALAASIKGAKHHDWILKNNVTNYILQAKAIISTVMDSMGSSGGHNDDHEFALWGASELLQNAADLLE